VNKSGFKVPDYAVLLHSNINMGYEKGIGKCSL